MIVVVFLLLCFLIKSVPRYSCTGEDKKGAKCRRGESSLITIELQNGSESRFYPFIVEFGAFSRLRIKGAHGFMGPKSTVRIWYGGTKSYPRWYWNQYEIKEGGKTIGLHEIFVTYFSVEIYVKRGRVDDEDQDFIVQNVSNIFRFTKSCNDRNTVDSGSDRCIWLTSKDERAYNCIGINSQRDCGLFKENAKREVRYRYYDVCEKKPAHCIEDTKLCSSDLDCAGFSKNIFCTKHGLCCEGECSDCLNNDLNCSSQLCSKSTDCSSNQGSECVWGVCCNASASCSNCWDRFDTCNVCNNSLCGERTWNDSICSNRTYCCNYTNINCITQSVADGWEYDQDIQMFLYWTGTDSNLDRLTSTDRELERQKYFVDNFAGLYDEIIQNEFGRP